MASPFSIFRKRQKVMIAVLAVLAMFSFVILPYVMQLLDYRRPQNPVAVKTSKFGNLDEQTLRHMMDQRRRTHHVLADLMLASVPNATAQMAALASNRVEQLFGTVTEETTVDSWLLAQRAERQGLVVDDQTINRFLREMTQNHVKNDDFLAAFKRQGYASAFGFFQAFRPELLSFMQNRLFIPAVGAATPAQRWDYFTRLKRFATIELVPIAVENFVGQVPDPDDATLKKFFEDHREMYASPDSPEPGFREPKKANIRYFKAEYDKFLALVSDEDVKQRYEKNKEAYDKEVAEEDKQEKEAAAKAAAEKEAAEKAAGATPAGEKPAADSKSKGKGPQLQPLEKPAEKAKPEAGTGAREAEPGPSGPGGQGETKKPEPSSTKPLPPSAFRLPRSGSVFRTVAFSQDKGEAEEQTAKENDKEPASASSREQKSEEKQTEQQKPAEAAGSPATVGESSQPPKETPKKDAKKKKSNKKKDGGKSKAAEKSKESEQPEKPQEPDKPKEAANSPETEKSAPGEKGQEAQKPKEQEKPKEAETSKPSEAVKETPKPEEAEKAKASEKAKETETAQPTETAKPKETPFERVKERIQSELAREKLDKTLDELQGLMSQYQGKWNRYQADMASTTKRETAKAPTPLDFDALATEKHLTVGETGLLPKVQAARLEIGGSVVAGSGRSLLDAFYDTSMLYTPVKSFDMSGNTYLSWKVDEKKEHLLKFDDPGVRQQVLHEWKLIEARPLARKEAQRLAEEARKAKQPLKEVFAKDANLRVHTAGPFSWMTHGSLTAMMSQAPPRLSEVEGVEFPGSEFMRAVFDLKPGEVGVGMDRPETSAYVIRMVEETPSDAVLWVQFETDPFSKYDAVASEDRQELYRAWFAELKASAGLKWMRPADRTPEMAEE